MPAYPRSSSGRRRPSSLVREPARRQITQPEIRRIAAGSGRPASRSFIAAAMIRPAPAESPALIVCFGPMGRFRIGLAAPAPRLGVERSIEKLLEQPRGWVRSQRLLLGVGHSSSRGRNDLPAGRATERRWRRGRGRGRRRRRRLARASRKAAVESTSNRRSIRAPIFAFYRSPWQTPSSSHFGSHFPLINEIP